MDFSVKQLGAVVFTYFLILTFVVMFIIDTGGSVADMEIANLEDGRPDVPSADDFDFVTSTSETSFFQRFLNGIANTDDALMLFGSWLVYVFGMIGWFFTVLAFPLSSSMFPPLFKLFYALPPMFIMFALGYEIVKLIRGS